MRPIDIPDEEVPTAWERVAWAESQEQYNTLPAVADAARQTTWHRWRFTADERRAIADGANLDLKVLTFGRALQPIMPSIQGVTSTDNA